MARKNPKKKTSFATKMPKSGKSKSHGNGCYGIIKIFVVVLALFVLSILISHLIPSTGSCDTPARRFETDSMSNSHTDSLTKTQMQ